ncbi:MAG: ABC transporter ATP-binding protein [Ardenticatenaceae bacterium]|nr:ABC transporter ATP-binding protein [Ardenticatenaceae bacterium]HBY93958.1 glutathione ABC transporter ATP-binding protein [Chloroflexota bacterium]
MLGWNQSSQAITTAAQGSVTPRVDFDVEGRARPLLEVRDLRMQYETSGGLIHAVDGISFSVAPHQAIGLVGESGCGKSSVARSILRLLPENGQIVGGEVLFEGENLLALSEEQMRRVRWKQVAMIFQSAMNALNPVLPLGEQLVEALEAHTPVEHPEALKRAGELLGMVGIARERMASYPHEMSGGMRQRAIIAMSLMCNPKLIIADEPTTALDVVMQAQILREIKTLQRQLGLGLVLITHDIYVVSQVCDTVAVMYGGEIVEQGPVDSVFGSPTHPYTAALLRSCPNVRGPKRDLVALRGSPPDLVAPPAGCRFAPRCPSRQDVCEQPVPTVALQADRTSLCHFAGSLDFDTARFPVVQHEQKAVVSNETLVRATGLQKRFPVRTGLLASLIGGKRQFVHAVDGVDFEIRRGEILGLVGESGCGKTTTGMILSLLESPTSGAVSFDGAELHTLARRDLVTFRRRVQPIFQDPYESINPRMRVLDVIGEPLAIHSIGASPAERRARVFEMLDLVGLKPPEDFVGKFPHQLSGGQRQRVAIARAMILHPELVVADEPVSMLDASARSGVMQLMLELCRKLAVSYLLITHDLAIARYMCDRIAIMYLGRVVEIGPTEELIANPQHPYTRILLSAVPTAHTDLAGGELEIVGEPPNPIHIPSGCRFHTRCPVAQHPICSQEIPRLVERGTGHPVACHLA